MPYAFKVTAKQSIRGSKGIAKGMSVQCVEKSPGVLLCRFDQDSKNGR